MENVYNTIVDFVERPDNLGFYRDAIIISIKHFPSFQSLISDPSQVVSPLDKFFLQVLFGGFLPHPAIKIDPDKVMVNRDDGEILFGLFQSFMVRSFNKINGFRMAQDGWTQCGPFLSTDVPQGYVYLEEGYISLTSSHLSEG